MLSHFPKFFSILPEKIYNFIELGDKIDKVDKIHLKWTPSSYESCFFLLWSSLTELLNFGNIFISFLTRADSRTTKTAISWKPFRRLFFSFRFFSFLFFIFLSFLFYSILFSSFLFSSFFSFLFSSFFSFLFFLFLSFLFSPFLFSAFLFSSLLFCSFSFFYLLFFSLRFIFYFIF